MLALVAAVGPPLGSAPRSAACPTRVCWGQQLDIRPISAFGAGERLTDLAVAAYIAKYATKAAETACTVDHPLWCRDCKGAGIHQRPDEPRGLSCRSCHGTGLRDPGQELDLPEITEHARQMIRTCWRLAKVPELEACNLRRWAHMLGFGGHFLTKSRRYSVSFGQLRVTRTRHARHTAREIDRVPEPDGDTVIVVNHWRYAGSGAWHHGEGWAELIDIRDQSPLAMGEARPP